MTASSELQWTEYKSRHRAVTYYGTYWIETNQTGSGYLLICGSKPCCELFGAIQFASIQDAQLYAQQIHNNPDERKVWFGLSDIEQTPYQVDNFAAWAQNLLAAWDQQYSCRQRDDAAKALSDKLLLAACFAGIAYDAAMSLPVMVDKAPEFLLRIFLIALVDQNSSELDPYRAKNRPQPAPLTNEGTKPVNVAAVREVPVNIDKLIAELKSAEDMCFSWSGSALLANELNATDTDEGHISLYKDLCGLGNSMSYLQSEIRALSLSEPGQGEQWQPIETAPKDGIEFIARCGADKPSFSCFWDGTAFMHFDHGEGLISYSPTEWMPLPTSPNTEAGK